VSDDVPDVDPLVELARVVEQLRLDVDEDRALIDQLRADVTAFGQGGAKPGKRVYDTWEAWVDDWLAVRISRHPHRYRWCHRYAEHPEVAMRLEALWHAWEAQWPQPVQRLAWLRDGLDHQLAVIMSEDGPLRECSGYENEHTETAVIGAVGPPGSRSGQWPAS
jgi:hypothetical protein